MRVTARLGIFATAYNRLRNTAVAHAADTQRRVRSAAKNYNIMEYFILIDNRQQGPYTINELRSRNITSATLVWAEGMKQWTPAWQVEELQTLFATDSDEQTPPPAPHANGTAAPTSGNGYAASTDDAPSTAHNGSDDDTTELPHKSHHSAGLTIVKLLLVAIVAVFVGAVATRPSVDDHREAVTKEINRAIDKATGGDNDAWGMIGQMISSRIVGVVIDQKLDVDNYVVCSIGSVTFRGKTRRVSFGMFGHVFTFDADDVMRALEKGSDAADKFHSPLFNPSTDDSDESQDNAEPLSPDQQDTPQDSPSPDDNGSDTQETPDDATENL